MNYMANLLLHMNLTLYESILNEWLARDNSGNKFEDTDNPRGFVYLGARPLSGQRQPRARHARRAIRRPAAVCRRQRGWLASTSERPLRKGRGDMEWMSGAVWWGYGREI